MRFKQKGGPTACRLVAGGLPGLAQRHEWSLHPPPLFRSVESPTVRGSMSCHMGSQGGAPGLPLVGPLAPEGGDGFPVDQVRHVRRDLGGAGVAIPP